MAKIQRRDTEIFWFSHHCRTSGPACHTGSTQPQRGISWEDFFSLWNLNWWTWCWWSCLPPACPRRPSLAPLSSESQSPSRPRTHSSRRSLQGPPARKILSPTHKIDRGMQKTPGGRARWNTMLQAPPSCLWPNPSAQLNIWYVTQRLQKYTFSKQNCVSKENLYLLRN